MTPWYHCTIRCVRRALLLGEGLLNRRQWVEDRIEELAQICAVDVVGFSVMDNHLHLLVRLDPEVTADWSWHVKLKNRFSSSLKRRLGVGWTRPKSIVQ